MGEVFLWWLIAEGLGLAALPITTKVLRCLPDRGYAFTKSVGLLLAAYLLWLGASTRILQNNLAGIVLSILTVCGISAWLAWKSGVKQALVFWQRQKSQILAVEILFLVTFLGWEAVRAYTPSKITFVYGEKYMEIAFLNGILRSPQFPPLDPWLSGYTISYYYFGYVMIAWITRLSGALPTVAFDLFDALLFALTSIAAFGVVSNLVSASIKDAGGDIHQAPRRAALGFGLVGALFVTGLGNLEGIIHSLYSARMLPESFLRWIDIPGLAQAPQSGSLYPGHDFFYWWWWTASRVIDDLTLTYQSSSVGPISEFPFFSFLLGDNHPHKMALPFVLLAVGLAFNLFLYEKFYSHAPRAKSRWSQRLGGWVKQNWGAFLVYSVCLGALVFLNTWDFPIYFSLVGLAFVMGRAIRQGQFNLALLPPGLALGIGLGLSTVLFYLPFLSGFSSQAGGVLPYIFPPTRLPQYLVIFGPFAFILVFFIPAAAHFPSGKFPISAMIRNWTRIALLAYGPYLVILIGVGLLLAQNVLPLNSALINQWLGGLAPVQIFQAIFLARLKNPFTFLFLSCLIATAVTAILRTPGSPPSTENGLEKPSPAFAILLACLGLTLTLIPEFYYLWDNFGVRMNTVFKFYIQGWVLMGLAGAYAAWWLLNAFSLSKVVRTGFILGLLILSAAGLVYTGMGIYSRDYAFIFPPDLDAGATLAGNYAGHWNSNPDDWAAIVWMRSNIAGTPIILEAPEPDYSEAGRVSAFTGFPGLLAWPSHENQWRGNIQEIRLRQELIQTIFTTHDSNQALSLLRQTKVEFVIIGSVEREYVQSACQKVTPPCSADLALKKFLTILQPVFNQGSTTVYAVPQPPIQ